MQRMNKWIQGVKNEYREYSELVQPSKHGRILWAVVIVAYVNALFVFPFSLGASEDNQQNARELQIIIAKKIQSSSWKLVEILLVKI